MLYREYGDKKSEKTLVTLPPLGERKEIYEELAGRLSGWRVISFDLPGHNHSASADYSISAYISQLIDTLDKLDISSAHFAGNSIGGWIIQEIYSLYPERVSSLLLLDGGYYSIEAYNEEEPIQLPVVEHLEDLEEAIVESVDSMEYLDAATASKVKKYMRGNFVLKDGVYIHHSNEEAVNALDKESSINNYFITREIDIPLGLLLAEHNLDNFGKQKMKEFKAVHPQAKAEVVQHGQHFLPITNTAEVAHFIRNLN